MSEPAQQPSPTGLVSLFGTAPDVAAARRIGQALVTEGLAACVNVVPGVCSIYRWEGRLAEEQEVAFFVKTRAERVGEVLARAAALHPYDVPCLVALPVVAGHGPYLDWVRGEVAGA